MEPLLTPTIAAAATTTALDLALEASAGGLGLLACGSGRKLRTAVHRAATSALAASSTQSLPRRVPQPHQRLQLASQQRSFGSTAGCVRWGEGPFPMQRRHLSDLKSSEASSSATTAASSSSSSSSSSSGGVSGGGSSGDDPKLEAALKPSAEDPSTVLNPRSSEACALRKASWVSDPANFLEAEHRAAIEEISERLWVRGGLQCATVVLQDLKEGKAKLPPKAYKHFSVKLFDHWGVGSAKHHNGILVVLFTEARTLEVVTGANMQPFVPDNWLEDTLNKTVVPTIQEEGQSKGLLVLHEYLDEQLDDNLPRHWNQESRAYLGSNDTRAPFMGGIARAPKGFEPGIGGIVVAMLLGAAALGANALGNNEDTLEVVKERLERYSTRPFFQDVSGNKVEWPYEAHPVDMKEVATSSGAANLYDLCAAGTVTMEAEANSIGFKSLSVLVRNPGQTPVRVDLPAGSFFITRGSEYPARRMQPQIVRKAESFELAPGEEQALVLDTYCGDSTASLPQGSALLTPYYLDKSRLYRGQAEIWRWSAQYQTGHSTAYPTSREYDLLEQNFAMSRMEVDSLRSELNRIVKANVKARQEELEATKKRVEDLTKEQSRKHIHHSSSSSSSTGFGGGRSGGGAGASF